MNPKFLGKLGTDEATRKQFEEDVKFLNDFSRRFREQQLANGREIISQGWFCDENGNWGGWGVSRPIKQSTVLQDMTDNAEKIRQEKLEERKKVEAELKEHFGDRFKGFHVKWSEEDAKAEETEVYATEEDALERDAYLAGFDGTAFASGSHTVVGTVVVRTSNLLTASQQKALEAEIVDTLLGNP